MYETVPKTTGTKKNVSSKDISWDSQVDLHDFFFPPLYNKNGPLFYGDDLYNSTFFNILSIT